MFTPEDRARLRSELLAYAAGDSRISGAAITGSAAGQSEDRWSDIDLAFGVGEAADLQQVLSAWTAQMYDRHGAVDHLHIQAGLWTYRVFLLQNTLQVDPAFVPAEEFRALAPTFQLIAGEAEEPQHLAPPPVTFLIGMGWLYALHARSSLARGRFWQAEYMISGIRDQALALACLRHGLAAVHAKGIDQLPSEVSSPLQDALVSGLTCAELSRAFQAAAMGLMVEIRRAGAALAERLQDTVAQLSKSVS